MSWQAYVDDHLMCDIDGHHLTAAAIIGHDGSVWAQSSSFPQFKPEEVAAIMKDFDEPGSLAPTGLHLGGTKYMVIQGESGAVIRGKKGFRKWCVVTFDSPPAHAIPAYLADIDEISRSRRTRADHGSGGITVKKTGQAMILGIYDEPLTPGQCNIIVERLGDYLIDQGL